MLIACSVDGAERGKGWVVLATQPFFSELLVVGFALEFAQERTIEYRNAG